ncbi:general substrate transporter [Papiliotrema laurentii]|uniref:General substrate transporter n=1 Tax=Papiliotrema laurentii TaxID=5418 RepID=A0AAD9FTZ8_PAPLA|nr:general substrate transporter [Papiliotrema laurentii]
MAEKVTTTHLETVIDATSTDVQRLIALAREGDEIDDSLTIKQALRKYKVAVFWALALSTALIMEGYDLVMINSFFGQKQFQQHFGNIVAANGDKRLSAAWQTGLSNSSLVGQLFGLVINGWAQDRFGSRRTYIFFMFWMMAVIFIVVFAPNLEVLAFGEAMCGIPWGVFQTLSTSYACEIVPTILRPYVTGYVCMCWGGGILLSSGVQRATLTLDSQWAWRLPFCLQWIWPLPLALIAYLAPESPWNAVRRGQVELARTSLRRIRSKEASEKEIDAVLALIQHTTELEKAETSGATYLDCFRGTNLRRTEINCVIWAAQILCGNAILGYSIVFLQAAGFSETNAFNLNISLSACYIIGGIICWFLMARIGRATIYMSGLLVMLIFLIVVGGLGFVDSTSSSLAIGILFVFLTLVNMTTIGPVCYPIVAESPSGRLRYKTITIGRFVYNLTGLVTNTLTPRMVNDTAWNWGAKTAWFYAGTNALCLIWCWFRLPETKDRSFGELDLLFENRIPARKFKHTRVDQFTMQDDVQEVHIDDVKV